MPPDTPGAPGPMDRDAALLLDMLPALIMVVTPLVPPDEGDAP